MRDGQAAPGWSASRGLRRFWFPFDTLGVRAQALVNAPAARASARISSGGPSSEMRMSNQRNPSLIPARVCHRPNSPVTLPAEKCERRREYEPAPVTL